MLNKQWTSPVFKGTNVRYFLLFATIFCTSVQALPIAEEAEVGVALVQAAELGSDAKANFSATDANGFLLGVVLAEASGKLLILQRQAAGGYRLEAASLAFDNHFGPRYYIEIVQASGARRFSIQVNSHSGCGIQVETFRVAYSHGAWRVTGYDKSEPDAKTCDVNLRSREYSANLLTHRVNVVKYQAGKVIERSSRITHDAAPEFGSFNFAMFDNEP